LTYLDIGFVTTSSGHKADVEFGSTDGAVLVSKNALNLTTISADRKTADLSPWGRWIETVGALEPYNVTVVGGRICSVAPSPEKCIANFRRSYRGGGLLLGYSLKKIMHTRRSTL